MGLLTDFFIATEAELTAHSFEDAGGPAGFFPTAQNKGIDPIRLAVLEALVAGKKLSAQVVEELSNYECVRETEESWTFLLPEAFLSGLAGLSDTEVEQLSRQWMLHPELGRGARNEPPDPVSEHSSFVAVKDNFYELCRLASRAQSEDRHMYLWMCL